MRTYSVDDLARYSPWPARLLGLEPWVAATKTRSEVLREFETERWGGLLRKAIGMGSGLSLKALEEAEEEETLVWLNGALRLTTVAKAQSESVDLIARAVAENGRIDSLVDLGSGYGSILFPLLERLNADHMINRGGRILAGELTDSGRELLRLLATAEHAPVEVVHCDLTSERVMEAPPNGATIVTSCSMVYVQSTEACLARIAAWQPRLVVHLEPIAEHIPAESVLGLLQRRYLEVNDYNSDLLASLQKMRAQATIELVQERAHVIGSNPLLPLSLLAWRPTDAL